MGSDESFKLAPALVSATGAPYGFGPEAFGGTLVDRPPHALVLIPIYNRKTSSRPMMLPPFEIRLTHPAGLVRYPTFPETD
jgi:hypothetical protein